MNEYFEEVLEKGKVKFKKIEANYAYGKFANSYSGCIYGFCFSTTVNKKPFIVLQPTFENVMLRHYDEYLKYASELFFKQLKKF